jgi:hypothetical protein
LEQLPRRRATMVGHLEGLKLPFECCVVSECAIEVRPARVPPGSARVANDLVGDGVHGVGHALNRLQPKSHDWWGSLPCPVVSPGLLHTLASPGRRHDRWSSGRQWGACTVPRRHRWSARRGVRPRASAPRLMSRTGRRVRILLPAPGGLSILRIKAPTDVLTADTGPLVLIALVPSPASLRTRLGRCHILRHIQLLHRWRSPASARRRPEKPPAPLSG